MVLMMSFIADLPIVLSDAGSLLLYEYPVKTETKQIKQAEILVDTTSLT